METINEGYQQQEAPNEAYDMIMEPVLLTVPPPPLPPPPFVLPSAPLALINVVDQAEEHVNLASNQNLSKNHHHGDLSSSGTYLNSSHKFGMPHAMNTDNVTPPNDPKIEVVNFGNTPGYFKYGCWYNSKYNRTSWPLATPAPRSAPATTVLLTTAPPLPPLPPPLSPPPPPPPPPSVSPPPTPPKTQPNAPPSPLPVIQSFENKQPMATPFIQLPEATNEPPETRTDPQVVEINILPGIQLRRTGSKLVIDIDFASSKSSDEPNQANAKKISTEKCPVIRERKEQMTQTLSPIEMKLEASPNKAFPHRMESEHLTPRNHMNGPYGQSTYPTYPVQMPIGLCPRNSPIPIIYQSNESSTYKENVMDIKRLQCFPQERNKPNSYPNRQMAPMQIVHLPPIEIKRDQHLVHHVQVEKKPSSPNPYKYRNLNIQGNTVEHNDYHSHHQIEYKPSSYTPNPIVNGPSNEIKGDRLVHHVQVEKKPTSPNPYQYGELNMQGNIVEQTDNHHQHHHHHPMQNKPSLYTPNPSMNTPTMPIINGPPIKIERDQPLVHHVQVEKKPTSPNPYQYENLNMENKPSLSNMPIGHVAPSIEIQREQRSVHHVQVEKKPSSPNPYQYDGNLDIQGNAAEQTDNHPHYPNHIMQQIDENVPTASTPPGNPLLMEKSDGSPNMEPMPEPEPSCVAVANIEYWPILGTRLPSKCKSARQTKLNQLQTIPQELTPTPLPIEKKNCNVQNNENMSEPCPSNGKPNLSKQMVKEDLVVGVEGKKPLPQVTMVKEKKNLHNNINPKKNNKSFVDSSKKIKIKLDKTDTSKAVQLTTYTSNMFDILGTIDTISNAEEIEGTGSDGIITSENDPQESIQSDRKELKKLKKKKMKQLKLQKQKQLEDKLAKNMDKRNERKRREKLQAEIILLRKIAMNRLEVERQNNDRTMANNEPELSQSSQMWCSHNYTTPTVIFQSKVKTDVESCSTVTVQPERLGQKRALPFDDSSSSIISFTNSLDNTLSLKRSLIYEYPNDLPAIAQDVSSIPLPSHPDETTNMGYFVETRKEDAADSQEQERDNDQIKDKNLDQEERKSCN